jgi:hypothetical protein
MFLFFSESFSFPAYRVVIFYHVGQRLLGICKSLEERKKCYHDPLRPQRRRFPLAFSHGLISHLVFFFSNISQRHGSGISSRSIRLKTRRRGGKLQRLFTRATRSPSQVLAVSHPHKDHDLSGCQSRISQGPWASNTSVCVRSMYISILSIYDWFSYMHPPRRRDPSSCSFATHPSLTLLLYDLAPYPTFGTQIIRQNDPQRASRLHRCLATIVRLWPCQPSTNSCSFPHFLPLSFFLFLQKTLNS